MQTRNLSNLLTRAAIVTALASSLAACSGGGGSSPTPPAPIPVATSPVGTNPGTNPPAPSPSSPATPVPPMLAGSAKELVSGASLSGFTVSLGGVPIVSSCLLAQSASSMPCGSPVPPLYTATTDAMGNFSLSVPAPGTYMLTIAKDGTYATLHRTVSLIAGPNALGVAKIAAISSDEQKWLADANNQRATVSVPTSYANMAVDEYAQEQARQWSADVVSGKTTYGDAGYAPYQAAYGASPGAMYGASGVLDLVGTSNAYLAADNAWMAEKSNCPNGNWQTCPYAANTGHYINLSNTDTVWVGLGESGSSFNDPPYGNEWAYNLMLI